MKYMQFSMLACSRLAAHAYEARDYKASNVGCCSQRVSGQPFCILDTTQILKITDSVTAVCTYPACGEWTYGTSGSYVGLAATAWAMLVDTCTMCGMDTIPVGHQEIGLLPTTHIQKFCYCRPSRQQHVEDFAETMRETAPHIASAITECVRLYNVHFRANGRPATPTDAVSHANTYYKHAMTHVDLCAKHAKRAAAENDML